MQKNRFIPPKRRSSFRDAKLIIIASEGTNTEKKYFDDLAEIHASLNVHVEVLDRIKTGSDPKTVLQELDRFKKRYALRFGYDELWLVVDVDQWKQKQLSETGKLCDQKGYGYAVSNPCFEIWLLLHLKSLDEYSKAELAEIKENKKVNSRNRLEVELVKLLGSYSKSNLDTSGFIANVGIAIERAKALDINKRHRWVNDLGSRIYLIAEKIINK